MALLIIAVFFILWLECKRASDDDDDKKPPTGASPATGLPLGVAY